MNMTNPRMERATPIWVAVYVKRYRFLQLIANGPQLSISADMFESVNQKILVQPYFNVGP